MTLTIDLSGVKVRPCKTDKAEYVIQFYSKDVSRKHVRSTLPEEYTIVDYKDEEGGELIIWYVEQTDN